MPSLIRTPKEEGHYTIKRVDRLPPKGNMNWLYAFRTTTLDKLYRWTTDGIYEEIIVGGSGSSITNTSQLVNDGATGVSTYVELSDLSTVAITGDYNNLINAPANVIESIVAGTNVTVDNTDPANPIVSATGGGGGGITSVVGSTNIGVDNTDPNNPVVSAVNLVTLDTTQTITAQKTWTNLNTYTSSVDIRSGNLFVEDVYLNPHTPFGGTLTGRVDFGVDTTFRPYFHPEGGTSNAFLNFNIITADREYMFQDGSGTLAFLTDIPSSVVSVVGGTNIDIDNTDVNNPVINAVDVVNTTSAQSINGNKTFNGTLTAASFLQVNATNPAQNIFLLYPINSLGGTTLVGGAASYLITAPDGSMVWRGTGNPDMVFSNQNVTERRTYTLQDGDGTLAFLSDIPAAGIQSVVAGTNVTVDNTDPLNPIVSATGGGGGGIASVVAGSGIDVDNTDASNPIVSSQGLELVTEGGNTGRRLVGINIANYGDIGDEAVDLSFSNSGSTTKGATGNFAFAAGLNPTGSGAGSGVIGNNSIASGNSSMVFGNNLFGRSANEVVVGGYNTDYTPTSTTSWSSTDKAFVVGTGVGGTQRRDGLTVFKNNIVTAPELTTTLIDSEATGRVLVTREWVQANAGAPEDIAYDVSWDGNTAAATKNTIYDQIESMSIVDDSSPAVTTIVNTYWASNPTTASVDATIINDSAILVNGFIAGGASIVPTIGSDYEYQGTFEVSFAGGKVPKSTAGLNFVMSSASGNPDVKIGIVTAANVGGGVTRFSINYKVTANINFAGFNTLSFTGLILVN